MKLNPNDPITPEEQDVLRKAKDYFSNGGQSDPQVLKSRLQETLIEYRKRKSP